MPRGAVDRPILGQLLFAQPVGAAPLRRQHVVKSLYLKIDRQLTQLDNFTDTTTNGQRELSVPRRIRRRRCQMRQNRQPKFARGSQLLA